MQQVKTDDPRVKGEHVAYPSPNGNATTQRLSRASRRTRPASCRAFSSSTRTAGSIRTSRTSRAAWRSSSYIAFAPDALAPLGGYPGDEDKARELFAKLDQAKTREDFVAAADWLKSRPDCTGKIGAVGFCYGGGIVNMLATRLPDLAAAVPFYGNQPPAEDVAKIKAPLLIHYAEHDDRINAGWPAYEAALEGARRRLSGVHVSRARSTASTTTRRRATTPTPRSSPGRGRWRSSGSTCDKGVGREAEPRRWDCRLL